MQQGQQQGGGACTADEHCNLNGVCSSSRQSSEEGGGGGGVCKCDIQWEGSDCGVLALLPADPAGGYRRFGFNGWGGNPFYSEHDEKYHVFTVEMVRAH